MEFYTLQIKKETKEELFDMYYRLKRKKKIKNYDDLIQRLIRRYKKIEVNNEQ